LATTTSLSWKSTAATWPPRANGFLAERATLEGMLAANPGDTQLRFRLADAVSWLGRVADIDGRYADAVAHYGEVLQRLDALVALEPKVARWRFRLADHVALRGNVLAVAGRRDEAAEHLGRAITLLDALVAQDPKNQQWRINALQTRLQLAAVVLAAGSEPADVTDTRNKLEAMAAAEPTSRIFTTWLAAAWLMEARLHIRAGRPAALPAVKLAIDLGESLLKDDRVTPLALGELARAHLLAGRLAEDRNESDTAQRHFQRAAEVLAPRLTQTNDWRLLDPAAEAFARTGRAAEARRLVERLRGFGYHSTRPFGGLRFGGRPGNSPFPTKNIHIRSMYTANVLLGIQKFVPMTGTFGQSPTIVATIAPPRDTSALPPAKPVSRRRRNHRGDRA